MKTNITNHNFYNSSETISNGELWNGVVLEKCEILDLSEHLSHLYIELTEKLSSVYSAKYDLPQDALKIILRTAIVRITHCFFERLIRVNKIVNASLFKPFVTVLASFPIPNTIEESHSWVTSSQKFNQSVISLLSEVWGLEKLAGNQVDELVFAEQARFQNDLFKISKNNYTLAKILIRTSQYTKWMPVFGRLPVLNFANSTSPLHKRFF
jgi:hypothetical protein